MADNLQQGRYRNVMLALARIGFILGAVWTITGRKTDYLAYTAIFLMIAGLSYNGVYDWKSGNRKYVWFQVAFILLITTLCILLNR